MKSKPVLLLASLPAVVLLAAYVVIGSLRADETGDRPRRESQTADACRQWLPSADGRVSVCLTTEKTTFAAADGITVRCVVRNDSDEPVTLLGPFGDTFRAHSTGLAVLGPDGPVPYVGPQNEYVLSPDSFVQLAPHSVMEESMTVPKEHFPGIEKPALYVIDYRYVSSGYPAQPPPANFWTGYADSNPVTVLVK